MSRYTMRRSINRAFTSTLVDNYLIRQQAERLSRYTAEQAVALENKDLVEVERLEREISELLTEKI